MSSPAGDGPTVCALCAKVADPDVDGDPPLSWSIELVETNDGQRRRWVCVECTRRFVRSIEAKLDHDWW